MLCIPIHSAAGDPLYDSLHLLPFVVCLCHASAVPCLVDFNLLKILEFDIFHSFVFVFVSREDCEDDCNANTE